MSGYPPQQPQQGGYPPQGQYPQQPYGQQPYGQQQYAPPPGPTGIPGTIIAGFIFSFLCPLLCWILIGVGWKEMERRGGAGKGLAIAGLVISFINVLINIGLSAGNM